MEGMSSFAVIFVFGAWRTADVQSNLPTGIFTPTASKHVSADAHLLLEKNTWLLESSSMALRTRQDRRGCGLTVESTRRQRRGYRGKA